MNIRVRFAGIEVGLAFGEMRENVESVDIICSTTAATEVTLSIIMFVILFPGVTSADASHS